MNKLLLVVSPCIRRISSLWILCALTSIGFATEIQQKQPNLYPFNSTIDAKRFELLIQEIRCIVCQNQNLAESNASLANDLRNKIYQMIIAKQSNAEIKSYLVKRYGEFILLRPLFNIKTYILWLFPFVAIILLIYRFYVVR
ncbi:MAG TPA: cytochrome c-type biogenesis protein [Gammaproteobacteria bacterium]|nr:cytochrome c-type biogenesis protein [Gammaproteobacteria bacterium]